MSEGRITREEYLKALDVVERYQSQLKGREDLPSWREFGDMRKKLGLSMQDVTNCTGVSKATISRLEQGGKEVYYGNVTSLYDFYIVNLNTEK